MHAYPDGVSGEELLARLSEQLGRYEVQRSEAEITALCGRNTDFTQYLWPLVKRGQVRLCPVCDAFELASLRARLTFP